MDEIRLISVIIPSKDAGREENICELLACLSKQKIAIPLELCQIKGVSSAGKARNIGAQKAKGDILIFIDDDIRIEGQEALARLIEPLLADETIAVSFSALLIPPNASLFERLYAREIPRAEIAPVQVLTDAGAMSTHFCAVRKQVFLSAGGFDERLKRGEDSEFSHRLKRAGFRFVLVPGVLCYHPVPKNIAELIRLKFRNGAGVAFVDRFYPQLNIDVNPDGIICPVVLQTKISRLKRFLLQFFKAIFTGRILQLIAKISYSVGYAWGFLIKKDEDSLRRE